MGLRDAIKKKNNVGADLSPAEEEAVRNLSGPQFTFIRSDTLGEERIEPPADPADAHHHLSSHDQRPRKHRLSLDVFRRPSRSRSASASSQLSVTGEEDEGPHQQQQQHHQHHHQEQQHPSRARRLSHRLHLSRAPPSSENVPQNLPEIRVAEEGDDGQPQDRDAAESQWEKRATMLAGQNEMARSSGSRPSTPEQTGLNMNPPGSREPSPSPSPSSSSRPRSRSTASASQETDGAIQEAIRLHEDGQLGKSTAIFKQLADPRGANNTLSQVLFGLALRHGWGCQPDPEEAVKYLSAAASNAASVEQEALQAGQKKGGALKGELVLAIFELANCFRHGWGIAQDPIAAKQYYETAANLGDTDAMNEVAWCYLEGFGCKKDKAAAAKYYRKAEQAGHKTLGNTWIWKEKYDSPGKNKK